MTQIPKLRLKIILSSVALLVMFLAFILFFLNVFLFRQEMKESMHYLEQMAQSGGHRPPRRANDIISRFFNILPASSVFFSADSKLSSDEESMMRMRHFFALKLAGGSGILETIHEYPLPYTAAEIHDVVFDIMKDKKKQGFKNGMLYYIRPVGHGIYLMCIRSMQNEIMVFRMLIVYSIVLFVLFIFIAIPFAYFLSGLVARPVEEAFKKQKQFLSDAGHELKTPISVIGANVAVLAGELGENKWLEYIKTENERMGILVKNLLYLARSDADRQELTIVQFDFSNSVVNASLSFESIAYEQGKTLEISVAPQMKCMGDEHMIRQIVMILVDNALKNSERGAKIHLTAYEEGSEKVLKVFNTGYGIRPDEIEKIFERFYRSDASRGRSTGSYGLGLPIARTIAHAHYGTLTAESVFGEWAEFTLRLPK